MHHVDGDAMIKQCCVPLDIETAAKLIEVTAKKTLKDALTEAVSYTIENYRREKSGTTQKLRRNS